MDGIWRPTRQPQGVLTARLNFMMIPYVVLTTLEPAHGRVVVVCAGVADRIFLNIFDSKGWIINVKLQHSHTGYVVHMP